MEVSGRILAIDYGSRRMGLAVSDALGITAQGIDTLERKNKRADFGRLERTIREYEIKEIVLGNPLRMSGQEGTQSQKVAEFAEELRQRFELPVHLWDERLDLRRSQPPAARKRGELKTARTGRRSHGGGADPAKFYAVAQRDVARLSQLSYSCALPI